jgi:hypothetical protein
MEKQTVIFVKPDEKKHSVRYYGEGEEPAMESIYVRKSALGGKIPKKLQITIEEIE